MWAQDVQGQAGAVVEPKAPGIFYQLDANGNEVSLEYKVARASMISVVVEGAASPIRFNDGANLKFLVKLPPGVEVQAAAIWFDQFESKNDHRDIEVEAFAKTHALKRSPMAFVRFDTASVGTSSVILTPKAPLRAGEYCMAMGKNTKEAYCFGVDDTGATQATAQPATGSSGTPSMTNADVLKMVAAGLSPDVIVGSIRQTGTHNFDLSIDGLISLKKYKVPDAVVAAMQQSASISVGAPAPQSAPQGKMQSGSTSFNGPVPELTDESVFHYVTASGKLGNLEHLKADRISEAELSHRQQTGWKVFGARSGTRFTDGSVVLVVKLYKKVLIFDAGHEENIRFRRWEPTSGARETWYSTRPPNRYRQKELEQGEFEFTAAKIGENSYKIMPNEPLMPGEYCISTGLFYEQYCFGIDAPR